MRLGMVIALRFIRINSRNAGDLRYSAAVFLASARRRLRSRCGGRRPHNVSRYSHPSALAWRHESNHCST